MISWIVEWARRNIRVKNLSTKRSALKTRKKQIHQPSFWQFKKAADVFETTSGEISDYFACFWIQQRQIRFDFIKSYLIPYLIPDEEQETSVIKKRKILYFSSFEMYNFSTQWSLSVEQQLWTLPLRFFPYDWFDNPDELDFPELPPYEAVFSKPKLTIRWTKTLKTMRIDEKWAWWAISAKKVLN